MVKEKVTFSSNDTITLSQHLFTETRPLPAWVTKQTSSAHSLFVVSASVRHLGNHPEVSRQIHFMHAISCYCGAGTKTRLCSVYCDKIWNHSNLRRAPRRSVSVVHFAVVKYRLAKVFIKVKLLLLTSKMWKKYLIIPIVIFVSPVNGGNGKKSGKRVYVSFRYLYFTTSSLGMTKFILMLKYVILDSNDCQRTNEEAFRYCTKSCSSDSDCKSNQKCLCDEDCGLSCVRNSKCVCVCVCLRLVTCN